MTKTTILYRLSMVHGRVLAFQYHVRECDKIFKTSRDKRNWGRLKKDDFDAFLVSGSHLEIWCFPNQLEDTIELLKAKRAGHIRDKIDELEKELVMVEDTEVEVVPARDANVDAGPVNDDMF